MADDHFDKLGAIHHYVPQAYLKRFSTTSNGNQVFAYEIGKDPYRVNVRNIAGQRDFYTYTDTDTGNRDAALEDAFADVDTAGIEVLRDLDSMDLGFIELNDEKKGNLLSYVAFQHTRNLQERKNHAHMHDLMMGKVLEIAAYDKERWHAVSKQNPNIAYDNKKTEEARQEAIKGHLKINSDPQDQYFLGSALKMSRALYEILFMEKKIVLVEANSDTSGFITSDNPVTHYLLEEQKQNLQFPFNGLGYLNAVFQFPISPKRCLLFINDDMKIDIFTYDQEAVDYINYYTYFYADKWIVANVELEKFKEEFVQANNQEPLWKIS